MEAGFIPNRLPEIQEDLKKCTTDRYADSVRFDHEVPLRGIWMKGEFSFGQCTAPEIITRSGESLQKYLTGKEGSDEYTGR